jgi:DNA-binding CsgD family transcriptional regulator
MRAILPVLAGHDDATHCHQLHPEGHSGPDFAQVPFASTSCAAKILSMSRLEVVGRDAEIGSVNSFLDRALAGPVALVLEGEPGIGKSTVWSAGVEHWRSLGHRALSARPAEAERSLAHAGLGDLLEGVLDEVIGRLSGPRRRALEAALLLVDDAPSAVDPRALGIAVRDALQLLAEQRPQAVAIDDLQWLDAASAAALAFAVRRLGASPVVLLLARRPAEGAQRPEIERALPAESIDRVVLGPLSVGAIHAFLSYSLGRVFARQTLLRIHEQSGGNPFYALEIARALGTQVDPMKPLSVPESLDELVRGRLCGLPEPTRMALALAAAVGTGSETLLRRAGVAPEVLAPALDAGVIELRLGRIHFTHPLLASAAYDGSVHGRLATIVTDPLARARHLALATDSPNAEIARALDEAAQLATERGAAALAAELNEHALRLTSEAEGEDRHRRALATARAHMAAGEWTRAQSIVRELLVETETGPQRAEALVLLAEFEVDELAVPLLQEALAEAVTRPDLHLHIRIGLAESRRFMIGFAAAFADARECVAVAEQLGDDVLLVFALTTTAFLGRAVVPSEGLMYAARAREIAARCGDPDSLKLSAGVQGQSLVECGEYDAARKALESDYRHWGECDEGFSAYLLHSLAWLELWTGNFEQAAERAARSHEVILQYGMESWGYALPGAWIAAYRGRLDFARKLAEHGLALSREQIHVSGQLIPGVLGVVANSTGDVESAVAHFAEADRLAFAVDIRNPHMRPWTPDYVEALLELGRIEDARNVLGVWEGDAIALARPRVLAPVTRCRGIIAAAEGRVDDAALLLEDAVKKHEQISDPFGRGRGLLALGVARRRLRQKTAARSALEDARSTFIRLGAATWAERARAELGRIGGRTREEGLTGAEHRVAALVAQGRTNREVAAALFLAERTVEAHLSHVYAKLGLRSRAELARVYRRESEVATEQSRGEPTIPS